MKLLILSGLASSWRGNVCFLNLRIFLELKTDYIDAGDVNVDDEFEMMVIVLVVFVTKLRHFSEN